MNQPRRHGQTNLIIRASAGTGKTFQLAHRFIALLLDGAAADRILATTFTRKAAGEILDRIVVRLAKAVVNDGQRREMGAIIDAPDVSREACLAMLTGLLARLYRLRISTLDSFFMQIARTQTLELGMPPNWRIVDPLEDQLLRNEALEAMFRAGATAELLTLTHLLTKGEASHGVSDLVQSTVADLHELFLDTDEAAWKSLKYGKPLDDVQLDELLESLAEILHDDKRFAKACTDDAARARNGDWDDFVSKGIAAKVAHGESTFYRKPIPEPAVAIYRKLIDHARALLIQRVALQTEGSYQLLAEFDREYRSLQQRSRVLRFADVTRALARQMAAAKGPADRDGELNRLAFRLDGGLDHVLLDEFQDTSPEQWRAIEGLAEHVCGADPTRSFFCVGDVKQAIYGWRGGVAEIFDVVANQLPGLHHESLNRSYRSSPAVIAAVNQVFTRLNQHPNLGRAEQAVRDWSERFELHDTAKTDLPGYVCLRTSPEAGEDEDQTDGLLDFAANEAARIRRETPGASIGLLVRKNKTVAALMARLRRLHVPASEEGGNPIVDAAGVQLILSLLRLADHPSDTVSRFHVATSPLGAALGIVSAFDDAAAEELAARVRRSLLDRGYGRSVLDWATRLMPGTGPRERRRLEQLIELAYVYQSDATLRADDFVRFVAYQRVAEPAAAAVRVMTIHQAKGLEFDVVLLPELEGSLLGQPGSFVVQRPDPTRPAELVCRYANQDIQPLMPAAVQQMFADAARRSATESLCVLYVAMTRAVHALHLLIRPSPANERSIPATFAGLLRAALVGADPAPPDHVVYELGDREWYARQERPAASPGPAAEVEGVRPQPPVAVRLAAASGSRRRGVPRTSPSSLEGGSRVRIESVLQRGASPPLLRGSIVHAWFEQIGWLDEQGVPDEGTLLDAARRVLAAEAPGAGLDVPELAARFHEMLARSEVAKVLRRDGQLLRCQQRWPRRFAKMADEPRLVVDNERHFAVRDGQRMLVGSIDRCVSIFRGDQLVAIDLVDFKTDAVEAGDSETLEARVELYRPQVEAYRRAVSMMTGLASDHIGARLLFVAPGVVWEL